MAKKIRVKEWIRRGELGEHMTQAAIIENCGDLLDDAEASEIIGEVLFKATNGKYCCPHVMQAALRMEMAIRRE